jgi:Fe-S-cluster containining protein
MSNELNDALSELEQVYQALDDALREMNPKCEASGVCCNFRNGGYILYASELETERVRQAVGEPGPWPLTDEGQCPFLSSDRKCSIHPDRPLGCRTYFCDPAYRPHESEVYEKFNTRISEISARHDLPRNYAPFHGASGHEAVKTQSHGTDRAPVFPILGQDSLKEIN